MSTGPCCSLNGEGRTLFDSLAGKLSTAGHDGQPQPALTIDEIRLAGQNFRPETKVTVDWQNQPDFCYYPLRQAPRSFHDARLSFADTDYSIFYIAPEIGHISLLANRHDSAQRLLGEALTLSGCVLGWRRMRQGRAGGR